MEHSKAVGLSPCGKASDWVVSSRLLTPGAAQRYRVGLQGVAPGWGPAAIRPKARRETTAPVAGQK